MRTKPKPPTAIAQLFHLVRPGWDAAAARKVACSRLLMKVRHSPQIICAGDRPESVSRFRRFKSAAHFRRALIAQVAVFLQRLVDNSVQLGREFWIQPAMAGVARHAEWP